MIPIRTERAAPTIIGDPGSVTKFKLEANAAAFRILSSQLYSDKPRAITRELSTNGNDSNREAGRGDVPISVHIPNQLNPTFRVTDTGIGMTREVLTTVFATYFKSTKDMSNEFNGTMGLGSKSPLSYTDSMAVTSVRDGEKTVASVYLDDSGEPNINVMYHAYECGEENGTTISLGVDEADIYKFQRAAEEVYMHFDVLPEIEGMNNYDRLVEAREQLQSHQSLGIEFNISLTPRIMYISENTIDYQIGVRSPFHEDNLIKDVRVVPLDDSSKTIVVMSNVAYPVKRDYTHILNSAWVDSVALYVPNGSVGFTPSREELDYNKRTTQIMDKAFTKFVEEYNKAVCKRVTESLTTISELDTLHEQFPYFSSTRHLFDTVKLDTSSVNYKKIHTEFTEFYWDTVYHLHYLSNLNANTSSISAYSNRFTRNHFHSMYISWLKNELDTKCISDYWMLTENNFHDPVVVLCDTRFNKKNMAKELLTRDKRSLTYVDGDDVELFTEIKRYLEKWYDVECLVASEIFSSGLVDKNDITSVKSASTNHDIENRNIHNMFNRVVSEHGAIIVPLVDSMNRILLPDDNFRVTGKVETINQDIINHVKRYAGDEYHIIRVDGKTNYSRFRASSYWPDDNFGSVTFDQYVRNAVDNFWSHVEKNRSIIIKSIVFKKFRSRGNAYRLVPSINKSRFDLSETMKIFKQVCTDYKFTDIEESISQVINEIDVICDNIEDVSTDKMERAIRKKVAEDVDTAIEGVDNLMSIKRANERAEAEAELADFLAKEAQAALKEHQKLLDSVLTENEEVKEWT